MFNDSNCQEVATKSLKQKQLPISCCKFKFCCYFSVYFLLVYLWLIYLSVDIFSSQTFLATFNVRNHKQVVKGILFLVENYGSPNEVKNNQINLSAFVA